jgi:hypothetical protein
MVVPSRALNSIEATLIGQMAVAESSLPLPPFIDDEGDIDGGDFDGMPLRTSLDLRDLLLADAEENFRRQIVIARELGPTRTDGGPFTSEFEIACIAEGVTPWPLGDPLRIERT